jgi:hypothetical protein
MAGRLTRSTARKPRRWRNLCEVSDYSSTVRPRLKVKLPVAKLSVTLPNFGVVHWDNRCHAITGSPLLNLIDKGVQLVVIVLEGSGLVGTVPFRCFSNPSRSDDHH